MCRVESGAGVRAALSSLIEVVGHVAGRVISVPISSRTEHGIGFWAEHGVNYVGLYVSSFRRHAELR